MAKSAVHKHQINEFSCGCLTDPCDPCVSSAVYVCSCCLRGYEAVYIRRTVDESVFIQIR